MTVPLDSPYVSPRACDRHGPPAPRQRAADHRLPTMDPRRRQRPSQAGTVAGRMTTVHVGALAPLRTLNQLTSRRVQTHQQFSSRRTAACENGCRRQLSCHGRSVGPRPRSATTRSPSSRRTTGTPPTTTRPSSTPTPGLSSRSAGRCPATATTARHGRSPVRRTPSAAPRSSPTAATGAPAWSSRTAAGPARASSRPGKRNTTAPIERSAPASSTPSPA